MEMQEQVRVVDLKESDVARVQAELGARPEAAAEGAPSREAVRQALVAVLPSPAPAAAPVTHDAAADEAGAKQRVDALLQVAVAEGIDAAHARAVADEPYVLDAFHDALAGALHEELLKRGAL